MQMWLVRNVLTKEECNTLISLSEHIGFDEAPLSTSAGPVMAKDIRNNSRCMIHDEKYARLLFERLLPFIPKRIKYPSDSNAIEEWNAVGLNERFRFYRYLLLLVACCLLLVVTCY